MKPVLHENDRIILSGRPYLLGVREAAEVLGMHPETLRRWDKHPGAPIKSIRINSRGDRRYNRNMIERFINGYHTPPPEQA